LILSFDDIISNGYRESVTISQIESFLSMESQDEKAAQKEMMLKVAEMRDHAKLQGREIAKKRLENNYKRNEMEAISSADFSHN
tara:strand:+ start:180 stop:431 length:252 start_codon:yes stop_codon:yes gene_type:complete